MKNILDINKVGDYLALRKQEVLHPLVGFVNFDDVIEEYVERRNTLISELQKIDGVKVASPKGAFYCVVELPVNDTDAFAQWMLEKFDLNGETVMVAPASGFYSTPNEGKNQVRIAYVLNKTDLKKSVDILAAALEQYNK